MITMICSVPGVEMSVTVSTTVSWLTLTKVVARLTPFTCTAEVGVNPAPLIVTVTGVLPGGTAVGFKELMTGTGYTIAIELAGAVPPPGAGFETAICADPTEATSVASRTI